MSSGINTRNYRERMNDTVFSSSILFLLDSGFRHFCKTVTLLVSSFPIEAFFQSDSRKTTAGERRTISLATTSDSGMISLLNSCAFMLTLKPDST